MLKHIPNSLTLLNLFCGCLSVVFVLKGNIEYSFISFSISLLADFLDGLTARLLKAYSEIGAQLDSLADMVSFGVYPGTIAFYLIAAQTDLAWMPFLGFLVTLFAALRLAIFNLDEEQSAEFKGLATPAMATFFVGLALAYTYQYIEFSSWSIIASCVLASGMMIVEIPMFSFKLTSLSWRHAKWHYMFILSSIVLLIIFKFAGVALTIVLYVLINLIKSFTKEKNVQS